MTGGKKANIPVRGWTGERAPIPPPPCEPKGGSKKNTKRWCGGKVGREHQPKWQTMAETHGRLNTPQGREQEAAWIASGHGVSQWRISVCQCCGRHLGYGRGGA